MRVRRREPLRAADEHAATWYKDALIYQLHVRAFHDGDGDGIGDFRGLVRKLDYLQDLGVTAIWLLPFYPSPLRDDGYDISDYTNIHPSYGTLRDFKLLLREARRQGLRVITELVVNHTSDQHPWFQRARRAEPGSVWRDFYVWSDTPDRYRDTRIIFKDFETSNWAWDPVAGAYYWHRFYSHQPDLNYDNPEVQKAIFQVLDFWLDMGVDGLRLDAVPYLFEREGTNCENLPETHEALRALRSHVDAHFPNRMLLAEANQWPEDAVSYFGDGDECHMAFHFPLMPRMFMAIRQEDRFPVIDILQQTPEIPATSQWALFLRNHDELTLEMVTDEERDYMYRVYAQDPQARINLGIRRRLGPLLGNNRRVIELMNGLLFSLPGTPVVYYGDEIGMGDNIYLGDRNGVRTPMQWTSGRNAGFSDTNPQKLYLPVVLDPEYSPEAINVDAQQNNPHSLLWWMKRLISLRKRHRAFGRGSLDFLYPENRRVLAFTRTYADETILVVANLSRFVQYAELDLSAYTGMVPVELFGQTEFPRIGELPYFVTLGPHAFYWFSLQREPAAGAGNDEQAPPSIRVSGPWTRIFETAALGNLEDTLPAYLCARRWFGGKARRIKSVEVVEALPVHGSGARRSAAPAGFLTLLHVDYTEGDPETYLLPLTAAPAPADGSPEIPSHAVVARLRSGDGEMVLYDATWSPAFEEALLLAIRTRRRMAGESGKLIAQPTPSLRSLARGAEGMAPSMLQAEQSNSSILYGDRLILKLFRRPEEGLNPDLEIGRYLTEAGFEHVPPVAGSLEYQRGRGDPMTLGILQGFVPNEGDAWRYTLDVLADYVERAPARSQGSGEPPLPVRTSVVDLAGRPVPDLAQETIAGYLDSARRIGERTAEMHLALGAPSDDPAFAPEPFTTLYQRSLYQSMRTLTSGTFRLLRRAHDVPTAAQIVDRENEVLAVFKSLVGWRVDATRTRTHGDYHLGQILYTGRDFVIIDFEGEPARPLGERRIKRSPLRDVAGLLRSFHYAAYAALYGQAGGHVRTEDLAAVEPWVRYWHVWVSASFMDAYIARADGASFLPTDHGQLRILVDAYLLEKAVYELGYELNNRPAWARIPIAGIEQLLEASQ